MPKSRFTIGLYVAAIFLSGVLVGGASFRLYSLRTVASGPPGRPSQRSPEEWRQRYVNDMRARLKLDAQQTTQLQKILDDTRAKFREAHERSQPQFEAIQAEQVSKINAMLSDSQKPLYEQWRQDREKQRRRSGKK
jgi:hypothetical protein